MTRVDHSESIAMWGVEIVRSGDEGLPWEGRRLGVSVLSRVSSESVSVLCMWSPRSADRRSVVWEYHDGWWALKSPRMIVSPWAWEKSWREGVKCGGHDEIGGMYMLYMCMGMLLMVAVMAKCSVVWSVWKRWSEGRGV